MSGKFFTPKMNLSSRLGEIKMKKLVKKPDQWVQMEDMKSAFWSSRTAVSGKIAAKVICFTDVLTSEDVFEVE